MIETLRDFVQKMQRLGIEYMVTGSYAMAAYGEIRMTRDVDVVVAMTAGDAQRFFHVFSDEYYVSHASMQRAIERRSMFNLVSNRHGGKIDCIIPKDDEFARASFGRRYRVRVSDLEFWTTTREDLIVAKVRLASDTRSEMQIRDIANLTSRTYDAEYVTGWIGRLGLGDIWVEVEKWKTQHAPRES